jgi:hypothetical protein
MSSSGPFPEKVSLRLHQETADFDESCKLLRALDRKRRVDYVS